MIAKPLAQILGILVLALAIVGLLAGEGRLFGLMNIDVALDILRIPVAVLLLYVGFTAVSGDVLRGALMFVGVLYVVMGLLGWGSSTLFGLLPNGLTGFDILFHLASGVLAIAVGAMPRAAEERTHVRG